MQEPREDLSHLDQAERLYYLLNEHMLDLHENEETFDDAVELAEQLLLRPTLPLFQRARCHLVLACSEVDPPGAVEHAKEAVHLLDVDFRAFLMEEEGTAENFPQATLDDAKRMVRECEEALAEWESEQEAARKMQEDVTKEPEAVEMEQKTTPDEPESMDVEQDAPMDDDKMELDQPETAVDTKQPAASTSQTVVAHSKTGDLTHAAEQLTLNPVIDVTKAPSTPQLKSVTSLPSPQSSMSTRTAVPFSNTQQRAATRRTAQKHRQELTGKSKFLTPEPSDPAQLEHMVDEKKAGEKESEKKGSKPASKGTPGSRQATPSDTPSRRGTLRKMPSNLGNLRDRSGAPKK